MTNCMITSWRSVMHGTKEYSPLKATHYCGKTITTLLIVHELRRVFGEKNWKKKKTKCASLCIQILHNFPCTVLHPQEEWLALSGV